MSSLEDTHRARRGEVVQPAFQKDGYAQLPEGAREAIERRDSK